MINLFYTEKIYAAAVETTLIERPCTVKRLGVIGATCVFRDGGPTGPIKARLASATVVPDRFICNDNEVIHFATSLFVQSSAACTIQAWTMGNPVGTQGSPVGG